MSVGSSGRWKWRSKQGAHGVAQLHVVLTIGQGHLGQAVAGENQLARRGVVGVDRQHAFFDDPREVAPVAQRGMLHRCFQAGAEGRVDFRGQCLQQRGHAGKKW